MYVHICITHEQKIKKNVGRKNKKVIFKEKLYKIMDTYQKKKKNFTENVKQTKIPK